MGLHFLSFWPFRGQLLGPPPTSCQKWPVCPTSFSILQFLAFWTFISLHFSLVGLHFVAFWPCGPSFPFILAFSGSASGPPPQVAKNCPFAQCPYNGFISAVTGSILQFLAFWAFISLHFNGLVGLHFLAFRPCGPSFPCILALWAFISLHFGLVGLHFLSFWPFRGHLLGPPPTSCQKWPVCPTSVQWIYQCRGRLHFAVFSLLGLHFVAFWPCGPLFRCILALWAFISSPVKWGTGPGMRRLNGAWVQACAG